ncbi:unnamed protein product [Ilex paraguariensis]|uniref:Uncharacterized protein n=1 Tax=Ilex paraguariensis TaxID=185542 RepID=A0ABC8S818_9AQUA
MVVKELEEEVPTYEEDVESFEDIQEAYDQVYEKFLKKQKRVVVLSGGVNTSEEDYKALHVDLMKSKAHVRGLEEEKMSLLDIAIVHKVPSTPKIKVDLHTFEEKRVSHPYILQQNLNFWKEKQVWVTMENLKRLTIIIKLDASSASDNVDSSKN